MILPAILNPFVEKAPAAVMTRIALDWILDGTSLDRILQEVAEGQFEREFLLRHFVDVMLDVACGFRPTPRAAFVRRDLEQVASISAFYRKLGRMELAVTEEIVRRTAVRARQLIRAGGGPLPEPIPGYPARIIDGNVLSGTEHRIEPLRTTWSAGLPGMSLAIYEPATGTITDLILAEDAHAQERALLDRIPIGPGRLYIADRNFCVRSLLSRITAAEAFFLVRWHRSTLPFRATSRLHRRGRCRSGEVIEQTIEVTDDDGVAHPWRRIVLKLDEPTRDGETEIVLITNLPAEGDGGRLLRRLRRSLGDRGPLPGDDRPVALRDPQPGLSPRGAVRLRHVGGGGQCAGGAQGEPAGGARGGDGAGGLGLRAGG